MTPHIVNPSRPGCPPPNPPTSHTTECSGGEPDAKGKACEPNGVHGEAGLLTVDTVRADGDPTMTPPPMVRYVIGCVFFCGPSAAALEDAEGKKGGSVCS